MELYIVRHGQSTAQTGQDKSDDPVLSEKGQMQADLLGQSLKDIRFDAVYASHQSRAFMTALGVVKHRANRVPITIVPELAECGVKPDFKVNREEFLRLYPQTVFTKNSLGTVYQNDYERAKAALEICVYPNAYHNYTESYDTDEGILQSNDRKILLASHGMFNAYLLSLLVGFEFDINMVVEQKNTCINRLALYTVNGVHRVRFCAFNDTHHLKDSLTTWK